jgi:hypothetical protein
MGKGAISSIARRLAGVRAVAAMQAFKRSRQKLGFSLASWAYYKSTEDLHNDYILTLFHYLLHSLLLCTSTKELKLKRNQN